MISIPGRGRRFVAWAALALAGTLLFAAGSGTPDTEPVDPELRAVLESFDRVQGSIRTLSADFKWTTESQLLKDPMISSGRFFLTKPDAIRWEFTSPEEMSFIIAHDEYIGYFPERKKAERRDFRRWSEKLFKYFGVGQGSGELSQVYTIRLGEPDSDVPGTYVLVLEPKKRRMRKKIEDLRIYVDTTTSLPVRIVSSTRDGGCREIVLDDIRINPDLSAAIYDIELPPDVVVTHGAGGLGGAFSIAPGPSSP